MIKNIMTCLRTSSNLSIVPVQVLDVSVKYRPTVSPVVRILRQVVRDKLKRIVARS
jgi:hypothetical protein